MLYDGLLMLYIVQKFIFTIFTLSCPIPGGIFTPTFTIGAVFGQLYISLVLKAIVFLGYSPDVIKFRGVYSILGAAAMTGSVTRTVSVAMIVLELNGHLSHLVPTMVCVICSYGVSELLRPLSFFEMLSQLTGLDQKIAEKGKIIIKDVLSVNPEYRNIEFLSIADSTEEDILSIIRNNSRRGAGLKGNYLSKSFSELDPNAPHFKLNYIPVVDSKKNMNLLFMVKL